MSNPKLAGFLNPKPIKVTVLMWTDGRTDDGEFNSSPSSLREAGNKKYSKPVSTKENQVWTLRSQWTLEQPTKKLFRRARDPVDNFGTVVGENPTPYGILALWAVNGLSIVYWGDIFYFWQWTFKYNENSWASKTTEGHFLSYNYCCLWRANLIFKTLFLAWYT